MKENTCLWANGKFSKPKSDLQELLLATNTMLGIAVALQVVPCNM